MGIKVKVDVWQEVLVFKDFLRYRLIFKKEEFGFIYVFVLKYMWCKLQRMCLGFEGWVGWMFGMNDM